jgi:signal transduction histidine kinase
VWLPWFESAAIGAVSVLPLAYLLAHRGWSACRAALLDRRLIALLPLAVGVALLSLALLPYPFIFIVMPLMAAAVLVEFIGVASLTLAVSVTMAASLALGIVVPPPLRAEWQQLFVYLALAAALVPAQLLAAALAELHESRAALAQRGHQLRRVNEGLEQFVRIASHDLREPLNTVVQFGALLERDGSEHLDERGRRYLGAMLQGARRMRTLLDDVLQFARVQRSEPIVAERVDLDALLVELRQALAHRIETSGAQLEIEPLPAVRGNASLLSLLFQNLVANALKFMPEGRRPLVRIWARTAGGEVQVTVADNGIGIAAEDLGRLFQPFQRLNLQRLYEGSGLGLALAREIAEAHGGSIAVASTPGEGSRFTVRLPAADAAQAERGA